MFSHAYPLLPQERQDSQRHSPLHFAKVLGQDPGSTRTKKAEREKGFKDKWGGQEKTIQLRVKRSSNLSILQVTSAAPSYRGEELGIAFLQNTLCKAISFETGEYFGSYSSNFSPVQARFSVTVQQGFDWSCCIWTYGRSFPYSRCSGWCHLTCAVKMTGGGEGFCSQAASTHRRVLQWSPAIRWLGPLIFPKWQSWGCRVLRELGVL